MTERRQRRAGAGTPTLDPRPDCVLTSAAAAGDQAAFEELYRRHAPIAWRVASAVTANPSDTADAVSDAFTRVLAALGAGRLADGTLFRSYLIAATRNAAIDLHRRGRRVQATDRLDQLAGAATAPTPADGVVRGEDVSYVAEAFRSLPERWRSVLWLVEVERIPGREAARLLGLTPNGLAQLAFRARAGLRERFVQAHLRRPIDDDCRFCADHLGAYALGTLSPRPLAKVDQHLAECDECMRRATQLREIGRSLRRIALPLPLMLAPASVAKWKLTMAAGSAAPSAATAGAAAGGGGNWSAQAFTRFQRPLMAASTGIFALGVISASVLGGPFDPDGGRTRRTPFASVAPSGPEVLEDRVVLASGEGFADGGAGPLDSAILFGGLSRGDGAPSPDTAAGDRGPATSDPDGANPGGPGRGGSTPPPAPPEPVVNAATGATIAGAPIGVSAGYGAGSCTGATAVVASSGCTPPSSKSGTVGVIVATDGSAGGGALDNQSYSVGV